MSYIANLDVVNGTLSINGNPIPTFDSGETHAIGDYAEGGFVLSTWDDGLHGLVIALEDVYNPQLSGSNQAWKLSNINKVPINLPTSIGSGKANTESIILSQSVDTQHASYAARHYDGSGYTDWFLPSLYEIALAYPYRSSLGLVTPSYGYYKTSSTNTTLDDRGYLVGFNDALGFNGEFFQLTGQIDNVRAFRYF